MPGEENKAVVRRFAQEIVNRGNWALFDELVGPDYVEHTPPPGAPPTRETLLSAVQALRAAFPDLQTSEEDLIAEGDKVVYRGTLSGTHQAEFLGIPPTGRFVTMGKFRSSES